MPSAQIGNRRVIALALSAVTMLSGCAAHRRDKFWNQGFAYRDYVKEHLVKPQDETACPSSDPEKENWICAYYRLLKQRNGVSAPANENLLREARNRVINGYLLLADTAYGKFEGDYQDEIAKFSIGSDLVNLGLTAASAVAGPAALLGAAATGTQGVQHSVEKNVLNAQTRFVIANRMAVIRENKRSEIMKREIEPVCNGGERPPSGQQATSVSDVCYTLEDALSDVQDYFYQGTIHRALQSIESQTEKLKQAQTNQNPAPTITSLSASSAVAGGAAFTLTVNGTGFVSTSVVNFGSNARMTTFVSATQLTAAILASDIAAAGNVNVTVANPVPGGGTSAPVVFVVSAVNPVPTVTTISPASATATGAAFTLTVNGTGFVSTSVVNFGSNARTTTFVSATRLTAAILASDIATAGTLNVTVTNAGPGGGTSNVVTFTVQ